MLNHFFFTLIGQFGELRKHLWFLVDPLAGIAIATFIESWPARVIAILFWGIVGVVPHYCFVFGHFTKFLEGEARETSIRVTQIPVSRRTGDLAKKFFRGVALTAVVLLGSTVMESESHLTVEAHIPHLSRYTSVDFQRSEQDNFLLAGRTERVLRGFSELCGADLLNVVRDDKDIFIRGKAVLIDLSVKPAIVHALTGRLHHEIRTDNAEEVETVIWLTTLGREDGGSDSYLLFIDIKQGVLFGIETITGERPPEANVKFIHQRIEKRLRSKNGEPADCPICNAWIHRGDQRCSNCQLPVTEDLNSRW